jgi:predicted tellurium resistance membrane protein TerC
VNGDKTAAQVTRIGTTYVTPAFLCLMAIETSDIAFAFDSVPAVIAVTQEPLLVYAAMILQSSGCEACTSCLRHSRSISSTSRKLSSACCSSSVQR